MLRSLRSKILAMALVSLIVVFVIIAINTFVLEKGKIISSSHLLFHSSLDNTAQVVNDWISKHNNLAELLFKSDENLLKNREFLQFVANSDGSIVYFADDKGLMHASDETVEEYQAEKYDPREDDWFKEAINKVTIDDVEFDETINALVLTWMARKEHGVVGIDVRLDDIVDNVTSVVLPADGKILIVDNNGNIVSWKDKTLLGKEATNISPTITSDFIKKVVSSTEKSFSSYEANDGNTHFILGEPLLIDGWHILVDVEKDKLLSSLNTDRTIEILILLVIFVLVIVAVKVMADRYLVKPLDNIKNAITALCDHNDYTVRLPFIRNDEIGKMTESLNRYMEKQSEIVSETQSQSALIADEIGVCTDRTQGINNELHEQKDIFGDFARSIGEMHLATDEITKNSSDTATKVTQAHELSLNSMQIAKDAIKSVNTLKDDIDATSTAIKTLDRLTLGISSVVETIQGIADQTNLLALNAAIEAARAGEHGRGFAVVADEVRALSSRTKESTSEIEKTITTLKSEIQVTVDNMSKSLESCNSTISLFEDMANKLSEINTHIGNISDMSNMIASATAEQDQTFGIINEGLEKVRLCVEKIAEDMNGCSVIYEDLRKASTEMSDTFSSYKVDNS